MMEIKDLLVEAYKKVLHARRDRNQAKINTAKKGEKPALEDVYRTKLDPAEMSRVYGYVEAYRPDIPLSDNEIACTFLSFAREAGKKA